MENASGIAQDMILAEFVVGHSGAASQSSACGVASAAEASAPGPAGSISPVHGRKRKTPASGGGASGGGRQRLYTVGSVTVCFWALVRILGIGRSRAARLRAARADARYGKRAKCDPRSSDFTTTAFSRIYSHLWHVYESVAECLADEAPIVVAENPFESASLDAVRGVDAFTRAQSTAGPFGEAHPALLVPSEELPTKALPPGCPKDYWWTYLATPAPGGAKGSYSTFKRVWRACFARILHFRKWGTHACCNKCEELRNRLRLAQTLTDKLHFAGLHQQHLERQWRDRMLYWRLRAVSQVEQGDWLCVIVDGADQAKFRVMKSVRWPKDLDSEHRPKVKVVGCLAHGHEISFNFVEENVPKGSNLTIEILVRMLDRLLEESRRPLAAHSDEGRDDCTQRRALPMHLWVQCDNAGGENKNQWLLRFLAVLIDRGSFRTAVLAFLQVGHTHEDIDGIFGIMSMEIAKMMEWDTPMQMLEPGAWLHSLSRLRVACVWFGDAFASPVPPVPGSSSGEWHRICGRCPCGVACCTTSATGSHGWHLLTT